MAQLAFGIKDIKQMALKVVLLLPALRLAEDRDDGDLSRVGWGGYFRIQQHNAKILSLPGLC